MFKEHSGEAVGFKSCWKAKSKHSESSTQSEPMKLAEHDSQTIGHDDKESQTDPEREVKVATDTAVTPSLTAFVKRASALVLAELERAERSRAFDGYGLIEDDDDQPVRRMFTLRLGARSKNPGEDVLQVSCLSWSSTGSVVAVGYSARSHDSWCEHNTTLALWNVNRKDLDANQPYRRLELRTCATRVRFHPSEPGMLAVGMVTGEVQLYSLAREDDPLLGTTAGVLAGHREPVSALHWRPRTAGYTLVTSSRDGKLLVWRYSEAKQQLQLSKKFQLMADQLPRAAGRRPGRGDSEAGLTALAFATDHPDRFLLGSEGGGIFLCSLASEVPISSALSEREQGLLNPVTSTFEPHQGQVIMLQASTFHRNIFASAGSDNEVRVWNTLQVSPLLSISVDAELLCAALSPCRPLLVLVTTAAGELHMYEVTRRGAPLYTLHLQERPLPVTALQLNQRDVHLLATGDAQGAVQIWNLATEYVSPKSYELTELNRLGSVQSDI